MRVLDISNDGTTSAAAAPFEVVEVVVDDDVMLVFVRFGTTRG